METNHSEIPQFRLALPAPAPRGPDFNRTRVKADFYVRLGKRVIFGQVRKHRTFEIVKTRVRLTNERVWNIIELK